MKPKSPAPKPHVAAIVIVIAGQRHEMTIEDARALHSQLGNLLGDRIAIPAPIMERRNRKEEDFPPTPRWPQPPIICHDRPPSRIRGIPTLSEGAQ